jgi:hypothetical protein
MTRSAYSLWSTVLFSAVVIAATETTSEAGTQVTVNFSGSGFTGRFMYDQSQVRYSLGVFKFTTVPHELHYQAGAGAQHDGVGAGCVPFTITTSGNNYHTFTLVATLPAGTTVTIVLPTNVNVMLSPTSLPFCMSGSYYVFPNPPLAGSTFTLSGGSSYSGTITAVSCSQIAAAPVLEICQPTPCVVYTYTPYCCPQYVCPPRRSCCLFGLFARRSYTRRCG